IPHFEERLNHEPYIDMCRLATAEEVRAGIVPVAAPVEGCSGQLCYTPAAYSLHLKNIMRLMDRFENYFFLPLREKESMNYDLFVNESGMALIVCPRPLTTVLEISRPAMVDALREHLLRKADAVGYDGIQREKVRMELRALIQELDSPS
ncbi:MAG: hypothetical protein ACI4SS_01195, partial [Clostridia bacterium]